MKTIVPFNKIYVLALVSAFLMINANSLNAQAIAGSPNGLSFKNPTLLSGTDLKKGAVYLFKSVTKDINATVTITDLVNGASVKKIDDNSGGLGYTESFQPEVQIGGKGESYALFTINFIDSATGFAKQLKSVQATSLDIDGNATLKEFADINMNGGTAAYMGTTLEILLKSIPIVNTLLNEYRADNILGIEHDGIDTSGKGVMFTVNNSDISSFSVKYGAKSTSSSNGSRQYSMYMKGFQYPSQIILPLDLISFTAFVNKSNVDLKWVTEAEKNVSHFAVEKSYDGKNYTDAATVFAFGNTSQSQKVDYSYTDNISSAKSSIIYYRLRCIDEDGKYTYSPIRIVRLGLESANAQVLAYPNPFVSELRVTLPQRMQGKEFKVELVNVGGQVVKTKSIAVASQTETITTSELGRGFYVIRITSGTEKLQYKVIKN
ncbi:MAG: T9SS type A sorting domain-containing protein [Bacteroidota bacterium]